MTKIQAERTEPLAAVQRLIERHPRLHSWRKGEQEELVCWGINAAVLTFMAHVITPSQATLETGAGLTTVCFAILGTDHLCISPDPCEHARIQAFCEMEQISTGHVQFVAERSESYLPTLNLGGRRLDVILIDGMHKFPHPIIDYFYLHPHLRVGGLLLVDDLWIPSVGQLHRFLVTSDAYEVLHVIGVTGIYRKVGGTEPGDWPGQAYNCRYPDYSYLPFPRRLRKRLGAFPPAAALYGLLRRAMKRLRWSRS